MFPKLFRYFFHQKRELIRRPRQYINEYDIRAAGHDEQLLMRAIKARSPEEAKRLMKKYNAANVYELIAKLQVNRPTIWQIARNRAISLLMRIEGSSYRHPIDKKPRRDESKIDSPYTWR